jgi:hypothetical protein
VRRYVVGTLGTEECYTKCGALNVALHIRAPHRKIPSLSSRPCKASARSAIETAIANFRLRIRALDDRLRNGYSYNSPTGLRSDLAAFLPAHSFAMLGSGLALVSELCIGGLFLDYCIARDAQAQARQQQAARSLCNLPFWNKGAHGSRRLRTT